MPSVAQSVVQLIRNQQVARSSRVTSFQKIPVNGLFAGIFSISMRVLSGSDSHPDPQAEITRKTLPSTQPMQIKEVAK